MKYLLLFIFTCLNLNFICAQEEYKVLTDIKGEDTVFQTSNIKLNKVSGVVKDGYFEIGITRGKEGIDYVIYFYVIEDLDNYFIISKSQKDASLIITSGKTEFKLIASVMNVINPETCLGVYFVEKDLLTQIANLDSADILLKGIGRNCKFQLTSVNISFIKKFL